MVHSHLLVTGAAGFIGSNFVRHVLATDPRVRVTSLDLLTYAGCRQNLRDLPDEKRHHFVQGDIADGPLVAKLLREQGIDAIVNLAAESHVDRSIRGPAAFIQTNVVGTFALLEAAREVWNNRYDECRFLHVSTDEVYGDLGADEPAWVEQTPYAPSSPYSASKAGSDHLVHAYHRTYSLPTTTINCSNNYGPYQYPEKLIPLMILRAAAGQPLPLYGDGKQIRDWLHVEDHCEAIHAVLAQGRPGETYHVGGLTEMTNAGVVDAICEILDDVRPRPDGVSYRSQVTHVTDRPGHDRRYAIDCAKISRELGWTPKQSFASGLRQTVLWYLGHQDWIGEVLREDYNQWIAVNYGTREEASDQ